MSRNGAWKALAGRVLAAALLFGAAPALAAPDLVIDSLTADPTEGPNGTSVEIRAVVRNIGNTTSDPTKTRIRINADPTQVTSGDTILCGGLATASLTPNSTAEVGCMPKLSSRPLGPNYIWAIADVDNDAVESSEDNNRQSELFTVNDNAPDLVIQSIVVEPDAISNGQAPTIAITIRNLGNSTASSTITRVRINQNSSGLAPEDPQICNILTPTIAANATVQVQCAPTISGRPAGTNYIWANADVNNDAGEIDRTNNRANAPVEVSGLAADLVVETILLEPTGGPNGAPVNIAITIRNQGSGPSFPSTTRVRINQNPDGIAASDPFLCSAITTPAIDSGASVVVECEPEIEARPPGTNYVWVILDSQKTAGQADYTNDRTRADFEVDPPPLPDLAVTALTLNPTTAANGAQITITAKVANHGDLDSPSTRTRFVVSQSADAPGDTPIVLCDQVTTVALSPNDNTNVQCKPVLAGLPSGTNYVWAIADITGVSGQNEHENDLRSAVLTVPAGPAPDLVVSSITLSPNPVSSGGQLSIAATIRNQGTVAAAASTARVRINESINTVADSDQLLCNLPTPTLAAGAQIQVACNATIQLAAGTWQVWVTADVNDAAGQADRSNDRRRSALTVAAPAGPDLAVKRVVVEPVEARNGDRIVIRARVVNVGTAAAAASATTFRINTNSAGVNALDQVLCPARPTRALLPGEAVRVRCVATLSDRPIGPNRVWATADTSDSSGQTNKQNDSRNAALAILDDNCAGSTLAPLLSWPIEQPRILQDYASYGSVPQSGGKLAYHSGIDLVSQLSIPADQTPVYAAADGEVVAEKHACPSPADATVNPPNGVCAGGLGNYVVLRHGDGVYTVYAHLSEVFERSGCVTQGQPIGLVGSSGATNIPAHLHFDVLANLPDEVTRATLGLEYYRTTHPYDGRRPENDGGVPARHLDPRDFMERSRIRITEATTASRNVATGGPTIFLARDQQYISYGELVPGFYLIDIPHAVLPEDGPPYADGLRYAWVAASRVSVLETGLDPGASRMDGYGLFTLDGVEANFVTMRAQASQSSAELGKAWGDQQFAAAGPAAVETGTGRAWLPVYVPGTAATGANRPREAWIPVDLLGAPPAY
jgi:murein DD-endopeptidase MepM/ murein hydrolase activator NlpD